MKTLALLRHAHAEPQNRSVSDYERRLDERGQREAEALARSLSEKTITFDFILCSSAIRTQETLLPLRSIIGTKAIDISENFYNISEDKILEYLKDISDDKKKVLYIGHNPGVAFAILKISNVFPNFLKSGIPPATFVEFQLFIEKWADLKWKTGEIVNILQPSFPSTKSL